MVQVMVLQIATQLVWKEYGRYRDYVVTIKHVLNRTKPQIRVHYIGSG